MPKATPAPRAASANAPAPPAKTPGATTRSRNELVETFEEPPITAPRHSFFTSPARSHSAAGHGKELPLHLVQLILEYLDDAADLARCTRTSRLLYYMTLPRLYQEVTLRAHPDLRYINGRPAGYGSGSPFAMGLNTLVSRTFTDYVQTFRVTGEWREHDVDEYTKGRVPDNSMVLQIAMRAALDRMKNLTTFAWELNTKPLHTIYEGLIQKSSLTTLVLRFPARRIPRPTAIVPPLPNLTTLICYDIDPLSSPDDISVLLASAKKLENLKLHWNPRMRETGEESIHLQSYFGRCLSAGHTISIKRLAIYNLYCRNQGQSFDGIMDTRTHEELTVINCMSSSNPMTIFLDDTWRLTAAWRPIPTNLKCLRVDCTEPEQVTMLGKFHGLERIYLISKPSPSAATSLAQTPTSPSSTTTPNGASNPAPSNSAACTPTSRPGTDSECKSLASDFLAAIQSQHRSLRHLLLHDHWMLSDDALFRLCQSLPRLEQLGFACQVPHLESLRHIISLVPRVWALRLLVAQGSAWQAHIDAMDPEMQRFAFATEMWRPEYDRIRYVGIGNKAYRLGGVVWPKGKEKAGAGAEGDGGEVRPTTVGELTRGPFRRMESVEPGELAWIEIWGMDSREFVARFE